MSDAPGRIWTRPYTDRGLYWEKDWPEVDQVEYIRADKVPWEEIEAAVKGIQPVAAWPLQALLRKILALREQEESYDHR